MIPLVVSVLGALGIGSVFGQWTAGSKDRRATRAAVLDKLRRVEVLRWPETGADAEGPALLAAIRDLETAALVARIPRAAVLQYGQLAVAGLWTMHNDIELRGIEYIGLDTPASNVVAAAAGIVSRAAWSTPATRWLWLRRSLRRVRTAAESVDDATFKSKLRSARDWVR